MFKETLFESVHDWVQFLLRMSEICFWWFYSLIWRFFVKFINTWKRFVAIQNKWLVNGVAFDIFRVRGFVNKNEWYEVNEMSSRKEGRDKCRSQIQMYGTNSSKNPIFSGRVLINLNYWTESVGRVLGFDIFYCVFCSGLMSIFLIYLYLIWLVATIKISLKIIPFNYCETVCF